MSSVQIRIDGTTLVARIPMHFERRGGRKRIVAPDGSAIVPSSKPHPDGTLVKALARAWRWQRMLDEGIYTTVREISEAEGIDKGYVSRILRLALLAPDIVEAILAGTADQALVLERLEQPLPSDWEQQRLLISTTDELCFRQQARLSATSSTRQRARSRTPQSMVD